MKWAQNSCLPLMVNKTNTVKPRPEAQYGHNPFLSVFEEHRLDSTTTDITTALFIL